MRQRLRQLLDAAPLGTLDRYLMRQFLVAYAVCTIAVLSLFMVIDGLSHLDKFLKQDEFILIVFGRYFAAMLPVFYAQYLAPVLTSMAGLFAVTLLNKGSELVPLKAAGISMQRILASFFLIAIVLALGMLLVQEFVLPNMKEEIRRAATYQERRSGIRDLSATDSRGQLITVSEYFPEEQMGKGVEVRRIGESSSMETLIRAQEITWDPQLEVWTLSQGNILRWDEDDRLITVSTVDGNDFSERFYKHVLETDLRPVDLEASDRDIPYLSTAELVLQVKRRDHLKHLEVRLHRRYAFPMANVILLLLGLPFVLRGENRSVVLGVAIAIAVSAIYLLADQVCADLGNKGALAPILAAWLPVLFFGALGLTLFDGIES